MECTIDLSSFKIEERDHIIFYASHDFIIYHQNDHIVSADCNGNIMSNVKCTFNYKNYEMLEFDDSVLLMLGGGQRIIIFDKAGGQPIEHNLPIQKTGRCYTKIFKTNNENSILMGTGLNKKIQFINYDFMSGKRISQSNSLSMNVINDCIVEDNTLYALLDHSFILSLDADTCATKWSRFETGKTNPHLIPYKKGITYVCQNIIRLADETGTIENIHIPLLQPHSVESVVSDKAYMISDEGKSICCCNLQTKSLEWEIKGKSLIHDTITIKGINGSEKIELMIVYIKTGIGLINLSSGQHISSENIQNLLRIRKTADHILLHKPYFTHMIPGVAK